MNNSLKVINAYIHDFASALWLASVLVVYWIDRYTVPPGVDNFIFKFKKDFFFIGIYSLVVVILTGIGRTYTYSAGQFGEDVEKKRKDILIIKHVFGFIIYGAGTYWLYVMVYG